MGAVGVAGARLPLQLGAGGRSSPSRAVAAAGATTAAAVVLLVALAGILLVAQEGVGLTGVEALPISQLVRLENQRLQGAQHLHLLRRDMPTTLYALATAVLLGIYLAPCLLAAALLSLVRAA